MESGITTGFLAPKFDAHYNNVDWEVDELGEVTAITFKRSSIHLKMPKDHDGELTSPSGQLDLNEDGSLKSAMLTNGKIFGRKTLRCRNLKRITTEQEIQLRTQWCKDGTMNNEMFCDLYR